MKLDMLLSLFRPTAAVDSNSKVGTTQEKDVGAFQKLFNSLLKKPTAQTVEATTPSKKPQNNTTAVSDVQSENRSTASNTVLTAIKSSAAQNAQVQSGSIPSVTASISASKETVQPSTAPLQNRKPVNDPVRKTISVNGSVEKQPDKAATPHTSAVISNGKPSDLSGSAKSMDSEKTPPQSQSAIKDSIEKTPAKPVSVKNADNENAKSILREAKDLSPNHIPLSQIPAAHSATAAPINIPTAANSHEASKKPQGASLITETAKQTNKPGNISAQNLSRVKNPLTAIPSENIQSNRAKAEPAQSSAAASAGMAESARSRISEVRQSASQTVSGQKSELSKSDLKISATQTTPLLADNKAQQSASATLPSAKYSRNIGEFSSEAGTVLVTPVRASAVSESHTAVNRAANKPSSKSESIATLMSASVAANEKIYPENSVRKQESNNATIGAAAPGKARMLPTDAQTVQGNPVQTVSDASSVLKASSVTEKNPLSAQAHQEAAHPVISSGMRDRSVDRAPTASTNPIAKSSEKAETQSALSPSVSKGREVSSLTTERAQSANITIPRTPADSKSAVASLPPSDRQPLKLSKSPTADSPVESKETQAPLSSSVSRSQTPVNSTVSVKRDLQNDAAKIKGSVVEKESIQRQESHPAALLKSIWSEHVLPAGEKAAQVFSLPGVIRSIANWSRESNVKVELKSSTPQVASKTELNSRNVDQTAASITKTPLVEKRNEPSSVTSQVNSNHVAVRDFAKTDGKTTIVKNEQSEIVSDTKHTEPSRSLWGLKFGHRKNEATVRDASIPVQEQFIERIPTERPTKSATTLSSVVSKPDDVSTERTVQPNIDKSATVLSPRHEASAMAESASGLKITPAKSDISPNQTLESAPKESVQKSNSKPRRENERSRANEKASTEPLAGSEYTRETIRTQRGNSARTFVESATASAQKSESVYSLPTDPTPFSNSRESGVSTRAAVHAPSAASPAVKAETPQPQGQSDQETSQNHQGAGTQTSPHDLQSVTAASRPEFTTFSPRLTAENIRELQALVQKALESSRAAVQNPNESVFEWRQSELGSLRFAISTNENNVRVSIQADRPEVADAIEQSRAVVERMINDQGLKIERFDVQLRAPEDPQNRDSGFADQHPHAHEKQEESGNHRPAVSTVQSQSGETNSPQRRVIPGDREWVA